MDEIGMLLSFIQLYEQTNDDDIKEELKKFIVVKLSKLNGGE